MTGITDFDALRRAMAENSEEPEGPARNARAEHLLAEAEKLNVPLAVIEALGHQLTVYNYSSEKDKMFVPFAGCAHTTSAPRMSAPTGRTRCCTGSSIDILPGPEAKDSSPCELRFTGTRPLARCRPSDVSRRDVNSCGGTSLVIAQRQRHLTITVDK